MTVTILLVAAVYWGAITGMGRRGLRRPMTRLDLGHDRALALYADPKAGTRSQIVMLLLMVCFTCFGLFLLSASNQ